MFLWSIFLFHQNGEILLENIILHWENKFFFNFFSSIFFH